MYRSPAVEIESLLIVLLLLWGIGPIGSIIAALVIAFLLYGYRGTSCNRAPTTEVYADLLTPEFVRSIT
jgi:hypothetical protein